MPLILKGFVKDDEAHAVTDGQTGHKNPREVNNPTNVKGPMAPVMYSIFSALKTCIPTFSSMNA